MNPYVVTVLILVVLLPALAFAGWRMGKRGRAQEAPHAPQRPLNLSAGEVRPRVRRAAYDRVARRKQ